MLGAASSPGVLGGWLRHSLTPRGALVLARMKSMSYPLNGLGSALTVLLLLTGVSSTPGQTTATLKGHKDTITCLAFAPTGKLLASGSKDGAVLLWDVASSKVLATLTGHKDMVTAVAFAPDGKTLASSSHDPVIRIWDVTAGKQVASLRGHEKDVRGLAFAGWKNTGLRQRR